MLIRTDPFRELDRMTQQVMGTRSRPAAMPIDAYRAGEEFVVELDLPGFDPDSLDVTVERNVLTIHAERNRRGIDSAEMLIAERSHGTFSRQLILGESLDADRLSASYHDGVLTLRVPVAERAKPRRVKVAAAASRGEAISARSSENAAVSA